MFEYHVVAQVVRAVVDYTHLYTEWQFAGSFSKIMDREQRKIIRFSIRILISAILRLTG
jgi:hypothetical protein